MEKGLDLSARVWLNPEGSENTGALSWRVCEYRHYVSAYLNIRDCSRQVELDFCHGVGEQDMEQALNKLTLIQKQLAAFKRALKRARYLAEEESE